MSHIQYMDELIREYLLYRCFTNTLKVFDSELKSDKDKGFRVDKIVDQLLAHIYTYDLNSLKELWSHLDQKIFSKLEYCFTAAVRKLESSILKLYLVNCVVNAKQDKINEFFSKMTLELQWQAEWKEWFVIPFLKNPEENATFAVHFTRQWQDTLLVSLHNFLATIFQCMPQPTLSAFQDDAALIKRLQDENEELRKRISASHDNPRVVSDTATATDLSQPSELMDDFYIIAQGTGGETSSKGYKTLIRSIGLPSSPNTNRRSAQTKTRSMEEPHRRSSSKHRISSTPGWPKSAGGELRRDPSTTRTREPSMEREASARRELAIPTASISDKAFLLLGQEEYSEHRWSVSCLKFNSSGSAVASADADGVIKMWATTPTPKTIATFASKSGVLSLDWVTKNERYLVTGSKTGSVRLFDTRDNKLVWELGTEPNTPLHGASIVSLCCNPVESSFICSAVAQGAGKLLLYDLKTRKLERTLSLGTPDCHAACSAFNHNGQLLIVGCSDGATRVYDLRRENSIDTSRVHDGADTVGPVVLSIQLTADDTACYTLGQDGKLCQRSLNQSGAGSSWEAQLPDAAIWRAQTAPHGQLFSFDPAGSHVLVCGAQGGSIHKVTGAGLSHVLNLGGNSPSLAADWSISNQCATCVTASADGKIRVSTLLTP